MTWRPPWPQLILLLKDTVYWTLLPTVYCTIYNAQLAKSSVQYRYCTINKLQFTVYNVRWPHLKYTNQLLNHSGNLTGGNAEISTGVREWEGVGGKGEWGTQTIPWTEGTIIEFDEDGMKGKEEKEGKGKIEETR